MAHRTHALRQAACRTKGELRGVATPRLNARIAPSRPKCNLAWLCGCQESLDPFDPVSENSGSHRVLGNSWPRRVLRGHSGKATPGLLNGLQPTCSVGERSPSGVGLCPGPWARMILDGRRLDVKISPHRGVPPIALGCALGGRRTDMVRPSNGWQCHLLAPSPPAAQYLNVPRACWIQGVPLRSGAPSDPTVRQASCRRARLLTRDPGKRSKPSGSQLKCC